MAARALRAVALCALLAMARAGASTSGDGPRLVVQTESRILPYPRGCRCIDNGPPSIDRRLNISALGAGGAPLDSSQFVVVRALVMVSSSPDLAHDALRVNNG